MIFSESLSKQMMRSRRILSFITELYLKEIHDVIDTFLSALSRLDNSLVSLVTQWSLLDDDDVTPAIIAMTTHPHPISDITNTFHHYFWQNYTKEQSLILNDGSIIKYSIRNKVRWISVARRVYFYQVFRYFSWSILNW